MQKKKQLKPYCPWKCPLCVPKKAKSSNIEDMFNYVALLFPVLHN